MELIRSDCISTQKYLFIDFIILEHVMGQLNDGKYILSPMLSISSIHYFLLMCLLKYSKHEFTNR